MMPLSNVSSAPPLQGISAQVSRTRREYWSSAGIVRLIPSNGSRQAAFVLEGREVARSRALRRGSWKFIKGLESTLSYLKQTRGIVDRHQSDRIVVEALAADHHHQLAE